MRLHDPGPRGDAALSWCEALPQQVLTPDILVVGGGPAGLAAALAAHKAGSRVLLLDDRAAPGRRRDRLRARAGNVPTRQAMVWGAFPGPEIAAAAPGARLAVRPRQLILAPGAHEAAVHLPGGTLPGCIATGALRGLVQAHRISPGDRVVIAGNGPENLQVALELMRAGGTVAAVVEAAERPRGFELARAAPARAWERLASLRALRRAGVPVLWGTRPVAVLGLGRVQGLAVAGPDGARSILADCVALSWGLQAETGLARMLGAEHRVVDGQLMPATDADGRTSLAGVYAVADDARLGGGAVAVLRGRAAGLAAARALGCRTRPPPGPSLRRAERVQRAVSRAFAAPRPEPALLHDDVVVCRCEVVSAGTLRRAQACGAGSLASLKRSTRAGMGWCGGRLCHAALAGLSGASGEAGFAAPRTPLRPVLAGALLAPQPEPRNAVVAPMATRWTTAEPGAHPGHADVVVIGAGIVGLATALYLARDGSDVLVLDRGEPGLGASTANAGSLHVQLLPYAYAEQGGGPLADALPLGPASIALWREIARDAGEDLGLRTEGGLILAQTAAELSLLRTKAAFERSRGIPSEILDAAELRRLAPALADGFAGASFCPIEGQGDPLRGTMALLTLARRAGARVAAGVDVIGLGRAGPEWRVETAAGVVRAGQVLNAAGAQAARIAALAGVDLAVHGLVQQVIATEAAPPMLRHLVAWTGRHLSLKQGAGGHLLIGGGWPGALGQRGDALVRRDSLEGNLALACTAVPALQDVHVVRAWAAITPSLDRPPVISATPGAPGLWHGVTGNGYTLGPVAGRMLADAVQNRSALPAAFMIGAAPALPARL